MCNAFLNGGRIKPERPIFHVQTKYAKLEMYNFFFKNLSDRISLILKIDKIDIFADCKNCALYIFVFFSLNVSFN